MQSLPLLPTPLMECMGVNVLLILNILRGRSVDRAGHPAKQRDHPRTLQPQQKAARGILCYVLRVVEIYTLGPGRDEGKGKQRKKYTIKARIFLCVVLGKQTEPASVNQNRLGWLFANGLDSRDAHTQDEENEISSIVDDASSKTKYSTTSTCIYCIVYNFHVIEPH